MAFFRPDPLIQRTGPGTFTVRFPDHVRDFLVRTARELGEVADSQHPSTKRLSPTAYPHDPEKDAGYQILARQALIDGRKEAISTLLSTAGDSELTSETLLAWMRVVNDTRLVLGTVLDVSEDQSEPTDPDTAQVHDVYEILGQLLAEIVEALSQDL